MAETDNEPSYIDYDTFLSPDFSPTTFANTLVLSTNNPSDTPIDLSTPLSKVLFDIQEIDTHIYTISTKAALPLLTSLQASSSAAQTIVTDLSAQVQGLTDGYERLEKEVGDRYEEANAVRQVVERLWETVKIGRDVSRCLQLCRQLEAQMSDVHPQLPPNSKQREDHAALPLAASTLSTLQRLLNPQSPSSEAPPLLQIDLIKSLSTSLLTPTERTLHMRCTQIISQFSLSSLASTSTTTYAQSEDTKARTTSACLALQTLNPTLLLQALQAYLRTALTSSLASLARALANLPTLERTLLEVSARCQNVVALESLLSTLHPPSTPSSQSPIADLLQPLLLALDTSSLPSYFWRTLAEGLAPRVADLVNKGGVPARALRGARERIREGARECVLRGSRGPGGGGKSGGDPDRGGKGEWEREAAVMVGSVVGLLGR